MTNKKKLQVLFFVVFFIGILLVPFKDTRPYGFVLLCLLQPLIGLHYITKIKKSELEDNIKLDFRYPLLIVLQITFIVLLIKVLFMAMHWPFAGPVNVLIYTVSIIALLIGIVFIIKNRKVIRSIFVIEFILLLLPVFFLICFVMPFRYSSTEYSELLEKRYSDLNEIKHTLYQNAEKDASIDLTTVDVIEGIKEMTIISHGGLNEDGTLKGKQTKIELIFVERDLVKLHNDSLARSIMGQYPSTVIEYLSNLTKLQIDLLLKEKK